MGIDNGKDAQLPAGGQLVMNEAHRPDLVGMDGVSSGLPEFGLDRAFGCPAPQLLTQLIVKPAGSLHVDWPFSPQQEDMHTPIPVADPGLAGLLDPQLEIGLLVA